MVAKKDSDMRWLSPNGPFLFLCRAPNDIGEEGKEKAIDLVTSSFLFSPFMDFPELTGEPPAKGGLGGFALFPVFSF